MGVDNKSRLGMSLVDLGMNALFGGGLDIALDDIVGGQSLIGLSARGYDKAVLVNAAADIAPCSRDEALFDKAQTGCDNFFFCL